VVEREAGVPVLSAAIATTHQMLSALGLETRVPNAGHLLSGAFPASGSMVPTRADDRATTEIGTP